MIKKELAEGQLQQRQEKHEMTIVVNQMTAEASDRHTDTDTHVIKKALAESQL